MIGYELKHEHGHVVIYKDGKFWGHAQSEQEACEDIREEEYEELEMKGIV